MDYKGIELNTLNQGAVLDLFAVEWQKLLDNINDPNTKPDAVRKVKIEIAVKPAKDRRNAVSNVSVTSNLASIMPHEASIVIGVENGKVMAYTFDPRQQNLDFDKEGEDAGANVTPFKREA
ncbi:MAG: hypothetical protein LBD55_09125 [Treponema sp.]|nr:hypothetical protein [Treponema sp.]